MKTLVVAKDGKLSIQEVNKPRYSEYQALVKTIACGMCGTDKIGRASCRERVSF